MGEGKETNTVTTINYFCSQIDSGVGHFAISVIVEV